MCEKKFPEIFCLSFFKYTEKKKKEMPTSQDNIIPFAQSRKKWSKNKKGLYYNSKQFVPRI